MAQIENQNLSVPISEANAPTWMQQRMGRFTASRISELCTKDRSGKEFGKTAYSYIYEVFGQLLGDLEDNIQTKEMLHGLEYEPVAAELLAKKYGKRFKYLSTVFYKMPPKALNEWGGASPDFMVGKAIVGDIKIPYTTRKFIEYLALNNGMDLLAYSKPYYYQLQMQMACTGAKKGVLAVFNPKFMGTANNRKCFKFIDVARDEIVINEIKTAIKNAIDIISQLKKSYQLK
jgi:hypothetical protein